MEVVRVGGLARRQLAETGADQLASELEAKTGAAGAEPSWAVALVEFEVADVRHRRHPGDGARSREMRCSWNRIEGVWRCSEWNRRWRRFCPAGQPGSDSLHRVAPGLQGPARCTRGRQGRRTYDAARRDMKHWLAVPALVLGLCLAAHRPPGPGLRARARATRSRPRRKVFEACKHGCRYRTIQKAVDAAGSFKFKKTNAKVKVDRRGQARQVRRRRRRRRDREEEGLRRADDRRDEEGPQARRSSKARTPRANSARPRTGSRRSASTAWC